MSGDQVKNFVERNLRCVKLVDSEGVAEFISALHDRLNGKDVELPPIVDSFDLSPKA